MTHSAPYPPSRAGDEWIDKTALVRHRLRTKKQIDVHKWYESERAGFDIGWDRAEISWILRQGLERP